MYLGRVVGTVVAGRKAEGLVGHKLLLVQPLVLAAQHQAAFARGKA